MKDSPLEALAFNYLSYGLLAAVNNVLAWIAAVTTAVSFWRMRILPATDCHVDAAAEQVAESEAAVVPARAAPCVVLERQGSTKMKFSLYYKEEEEEEDLWGDDEDGGEIEESGVSLGFEIGGNWEWDAAIALRRGDLGFYTWQDRTVLSGNVVRLWEGRRRKQHHQVVDGGVVVW
ncbi:uncharacterized protein LOC121752793 [Salvia splendens]|uniref:uncharacterized protein LOC121752793 n=1 Tax=Salvia splendens TaxID=180675 RepID=UPI001C254BFA|nr:uncharacterized protein LOC121752793 [Salvia splendens]